MKIIALAFFLVVFIGRGESPCPMEVLSYPALEKIGELSLSEGFFEY